MSDERLRELLEVQAYFRLPSPALVEKDFYVVKALAAIAAINPAPLRLGLVVTSVPKVTLRNPFVVKGLRDSRWRNPLKSM